jgi:hypothetical protein
MSWVNDLASVAGIPAGAATLAVAMYAGCTAAEKAARPEALQDIGSILMDTTWERSVRPAAIIERMFNWTFGDRQISCRCLTRSIAATFGFLVAVMVVYFSHSTSYASAQDSGKSDTYLLVTFFVSVVSGCVIPDYIALGKTRMLLRYIPNLQPTFPLVLIILLDVVLSLMISTLGISIGSTLLVLSGPPSHWWSLISFPPTLGIYMALFFYRGLEGIAELFHVGFGDEAFVMYGIFCSTALFTAVWTILILLSTTVLKFLAPIHRFTAWFFDVEKHPVQAIGIVAGALVMIGSLIWTVLRAVI